MSLSSAAASSSKSKSRRKVFLIISVILPLVLAVLVPIFISETVGGWTRKYTSPVRFQPSRDIPNLQGKVAIVTGSNTGIGYHTALELAKKGAHVIAAARSEVRGMTAIHQMEREMKGIPEKSKGKLTFLPLDLSSLDSVEQFVKKFKALKLPSLDLLILNAGVMKSPGSEFIGQELTYGFEVTQDGFEYHIGVNHIAHAYLTNLLLENLQRSGTDTKADSPSRVISVSSMAEQGAYSEGFLFQDWKPARTKAGDVIMPESYEDGRAYGQSKLANLMWAKALADRVNNTGVVVYSVHPGLIVSELSRYMEKELMSNDTSNSMQSILMKILMSVFTNAMFSTKDGALAQLHLATAPVDSLVNGGFYHPIGRLTKPFHKTGMDDNLRDELWEETQNAIRLRKDYQYKSKV